MSAPLIAIAGPTASGKSALALELAERLDAEIVSVDSAQVYRRLDIGSAKPDAETQARVRHWLIDLREPWQSYSAAEFVRDAEAAIADIEARGKRALLVGGTMLYFRALLHGLSALPEADPAIRAELAARRESEGLAALHAELARLDPAAAARIHPHDPQRILRALEVIAQAGRPLSELQTCWQQAPRRPARMLALAPGDRSVLHRRIEERLESMFATGFVEEVAALRALPDFDPDWPSMRSVGYRQVLGHLAGAYDRQRAFELSLYATRQLAKRQLTWLRGEPDLHWLDPGTGDALAHSLAWLGAD